MPGIFKEIAEFFSPPAYVVSKPRTEKGVDSRIVSYADNASFIAEQYRVLRTNLYSLSPESPLKTIVITSTQSGEGKTITACNLSYTLSLDSEKKTLLIDCDLRRSTVHSTLSLLRKPGFSELINGKVDAEYFLSKPAFGNLYVIPAGAAVDNPSELLGSAKTKALLDLVKARFDSVIFDTPPVVNVTDSSILGSLCDAVILVVKAGATPRDMVKESFNMLRHAHAEPKACVLTNATIPLHQYFLSSYRYYYRYRYNYKSREKT